MIVKNLLGFGLLVAGALAIVWLAKPLTPEQIASRAAAEKDRQDRCALDLECFAAQHWPTAEVLCQARVERIAKNNFEWMDKDGGKKFPYHQWKDQPKRIISYVGDKIKFQNGFGAWTIHTYACVFDAPNQKVIDVAARAGRI